jgi:hypothetical protein
VSTSALGLPARPDTSPAAPRVAAGPADPTPTADKNEPSKKKRGFWGRLFGRKDKAEDPPKESPKHR